MNSKMRGLFFLIITLGSSLSFASVELKCADVGTIKIICNFAIVDGNAAEYKPANERQLGDAIVLHSGESKMLSDDYLGKYFCPQRVDAETEKNNCRGKRKIEAVNSFGGIFTDSVTYIPVNKKNADVDKCALLNKELVGRKYDYLKDGLMEWWVVSGNSYYFGKGFVTTEEQQLTSKVCKGKWFLNEGADKYTGISDFEVPTYAGAVKSQADYQELKFHELQDETIKNGYVTHARGRVYWYGVYQEITYEVRVTHAGDYDSALLPAEKIKVLARVGGVWITKECSHTAVCGDTIREYGVVSPSSLASVSGHSELNGLQENVEAH